MDADLSAYIGIPFEELNCYELLRRIYKDFFAIALPGQPHDDPSDRRSYSKLMQAEAVNWLPVEAGDERFGDVVLLHIFGLPCHIGFVAGGGMMVHAQRGTASTYESYRESLHWRERRKFFYRHPVLSERAVTPD